MEWMIDKKFDRGVDDATPEELDFVAERKLRNAVLFEARAVFG